MTIPKIDAPTSGEMSGTVWVNISRQYQYVPIGYPPPFRDGSLVILGQWDVGADLP